MAKVSFGKKLQLKRTVVTPIADSALSAVNGGEADLQQVYEDPWGGGGGGFWSLWDCPRPGQSQTYGCDTNATCANTGCGTCPTVCTCTANPSCGG
jgi:hypothetical protein